MIRHNHVPAQIVLDPVKMTQNVFHDVRNFSVGKDTRTKSCCQEYLDLLADGSTKL